MEIFFPKLDEKLDTTNMSVCYIGSDKLILPCGKQLAWLCNKILLPATLKFTNMLSV